MGEKVWGKNILTCTVITKWDLVGGCCREVGAEVGVGGWPRWCRLPGTSSRRMPPPTAFTGSPAHGHGHAQPVATADTVAAAAVAHNSRRRASTCCLQHLAAPPAAVAFIWMLLPPSCVPLWPSPFTVGCHLWDAARGALQFQCSPCAVALSCWWLAAAWLCAQKLHHNAWMHGICLCLQQAWAAFDKCHSRARHFAGVFVFPYKMSGTCV